MPKTKVTVECDGDILTHIAGGLADYATLCGLDGDDPGCNQRIIETDSKKKIDCPNCKQLWEISKRFNSSDFVKGK